MTRTPQHPQNSAEVAAHAAELIAFYGPPIHSYSRAEAVRDGLFVNVTGTPEHPEMGMVWPVHLSAEVHDRYVKWDREDNARQDYQEQSARLRDVLTCLRQEARKPKNEGMQVVVFTLAAIPRDEAMRFTEICAELLVVQYGPNDDLSPLVTVWTLEEAQEEGLL